jgi:hypothetical protein
MSTRESFQALADGLDVTSKTSLAVSVSTALTTPPITLLIIVSVITLLEEEASSQESPAYEENAPPKNPSLKFPPDI